MCSNDQKWINANSTGPEPFLSYNDPFSSQLHSSNTFDSNITQYIPAGKVKESLNRYIHDILQKSNLQLSANLFAREAGIDTNVDRLHKSLLPLSNSNTTNGFLTEWWEIFWDLFNIASKKSGSEICSKYNKIINNKRRIETINQNQKFQAAKLQDYYNVQNESTYPGTMNPQTLLSMTMNQNVYRDDLNTTKPGINSNGDFNNCRRQKMVSIPENQVLTNIQVYENSHPKNMIGQSGLLISEPPGAIECQVAKPVPNENTYINLSVVKSEEEFNRQTKLQPIKNYNTNDNPDDKLCNVDTKYTKSRNRKKNKTEVVYNIKSTSPMKLKSNNVSTVKITKQKMDDRCLTIGKNKKKDIKIEKSTKESISKKSSDDKISLSNVTETPKSSVSLSGYKEFRMDFYPGNHDSLTKKQLVSDSPSARRTPMRTTFATFHKDGDLTEEVHNAPWSSTADKSVLLSLQPSTSNNSERKIISEEMLGIQKHIGNLSSSVSFNTSAVSGASGVESKPVTTKDPIKSRSVKTMFDQESIVNSLKKATEHINKSPVRASITKENSHNNKITKSFHRSPKNIDRKLVSAAVTGAPSKTPSIMKKNKKTEKYSYELKSAPSCHNEVGEAVSSTGSHSYVNGTLPSQHFHISNNGLTNIPFKEFTSFGNLGSPYDDDFKSLDAIANNSGSMVQSRDIDNKDSVGHQNSEQEYPNDFDFDFFDWKI